MKTKSLLNKLDKKQLKMLNRIIISMILFVFAIVLEQVVLPEDINKWLHFGLYLIPYLFIGYDVIRKCALGIAHGQWFDESFLMTIATIGAFGCQEFEEAVAVMLFYQVGEFFQNYAIGKSRNAISELISIAPEYANRILNDGSMEVIDPDDIEVGDILAVKPGEKIPVDGEVIKGEGWINTSALTGESAPVFAKSGDKVISGCVNGESLIHIKADKLYDDSTVAQILEMVETAADKKGTTESFITRFAKYYTPIVVLSGVILALIPPIFDGNWSMWILRACTFLVISCPCALVISVPLAFFGGIGAASKIGVLVKGSNYLEMMSNVDVLVADKTGTLTQGKFSVKRVESVEGYTEEDVIRYAAAVESGSTHPIGQSIIEACNNPFNSAEVSNVENLSGKGIKAVINNLPVMVGNRQLMDDNNIQVVSHIKESATVVYVSLDGKCIGCIEVADAPKEGIKETIRSIMAEGVRRVVMLTGDAKEPATRVAAELGISDVRAQLLPQNKVQAVEGLLAELAPKKYLAFVGDGINDAPVLTRADIGIAMGSLGSDAAIEAADIVIMDDNLAKIPALIRIARKTLSISRTNIVFALAVKAICLILGAIGIANMWAAVFADVGVAMICILNSMRMLRNNESL